jgi:hypothetical protein
MACLAALRQSVWSVSTGHEIDTQQKSPYLRQNDLFYRDLSDGAL